MRLAGIAHLPARLATQPDTALVRAPRCLLEAPVLHLMTAPALRALAAPTLHLMTAYAVNALAAATLHVLTVALTADVAGMPVTAAGLMSSPSDLAVLQPLPLSTAMPRLLQW